MKANFFIEYIKHPQTIGAVVPSSKYLAENMIKNIDWTNCSAIAEYGAGTGVFTAGVIRHRKKGTKFLVVEQNERFYNILCKRFGKCRDVFIIHGDARNLEKYMSKYNIDKIDCIISGLPFASLPSDISDRILASTKRILSKNGGKFITFQYTLFKKKLFERFFDIEDISVALCNLPLAFVLTMIPKDKRC